MPSSDIQDYPRLTTVFYHHSDVEFLAKNLLGKVLVTQFDQAITSGEIVETEAYKAPEDKASHAFANRRTARTEIMFSSGGKAYVYLCYGIHHLFNVVTGPEDAAHAVLIRALRPIDNLELMQSRRGVKIENKLCAGPGTLSQALGIFTSHSGLSLTDLASPIWIEDRGIKIDQHDIIESPRVGVAYAAECARWPWRFRIKNSPYTSKAK